MVRGSCSKPDDEGCECDGAKVNVGAFLVAGGDGAEAFEAVDGAFDGVALLVALAVEDGGSTASGTSVLAVSLLVETFGDGVRDAASSQVAAVHPGRVCLVRQDTIGSGARSPGSGSGHRDLLQHPLQLGSVAVVSGCQDKAERSAAPVSDEVDLGGESTSGTSQTLADLTTSSSRTTSFRSTGSTWFVPRAAPF